MSQFVKIDLYLSPIGRSLRQLHITTDIYITALITNVMTAQMYISLLDVYGRQLTMSQFVKIGLYLSPIGSSFI